MLTSAANLGSGVASSDRVGVGSSEIKNHYNQVNTIDRRWEEQTALLSGAEFGRGLDMAARRRRVTQDTGGMIATETGGAMNEEFLRSYFSEVRLLFFVKPGGILILFLRLFVGRGVSSFTLLQHIE